MKKILSILLSICSLGAVAQGNYVFRGGELANFGIIDISARNGLSWGTDRSGTPGYFSLVDTANFTGCTDAANINGYVKKYGNQSFIFPVGSGNDIRTLSISAPALASDAYATAWISGNPGQVNDPTGPFAGTHPINAVTPPISQVSELGEWDWQTGKASALGPGTTGTGAGLTITVSIPDMRDFAFKNELRLVGWNGSTWVDLSGHPAATGNTENSLLSGVMLPDISAIAIGSVGKNRPFRLDGFSAAAVNCNALIKWDGYNEAVVRTYFVEKSFDDIHYAELGTVNPKNNGNQASYNYTTAMAYGKAYFRVRVLKTDGTSEYSNSIEVTSTCGVREYMVSYPNPVTAYDNVYLNFSTTYRGRAALLLFNSVGQKMMEKQLLINTDINIVNIDMRSYAAGVYFLNLVSESGKQIGTTQKFIKQ